MPSDVLLGINQQTAFKASGFVAHRSERSFLIKKQRNALGCARHNHCEDPSGRQHAALGFNQIPRTFQTSLHPPDSKGRVLGLSFQSDIGKVITTAEIAVVGEDDSLKEQRLSNIVVLHEQTGHQTAVHIAGASFQDDLAAYRKQTLQLLDRQARPRLLLSQWRLNTRQTHRTPLITKVDEHLLTIVDCQNHDGLTRMGLSPGC